MTSKIKHLLSRHHDRAAKRHSSYHDGDLPGPAFPDAALDTGDLEMGTSSFGQNHGVPYIVVTSPVNFQPEHSESVSPSFPFVVPASPVNNDDADFVAWLHVNNELQLNKEVADHIDPHVRKRYLRYLSELRAHDGRARSASTSGLSAMGNARGSNTSLTTTSYSSESSGRRSTGIIHVLHLDVLDRKKQRMIKKKEERLRNERLDMEKWEGRIKAQHEREVRADNEALRDATRPSMLIAA